MEDQNYILFEAYVSEELSAEEIVDFESKLENDSEFQQAFETFKELSSFLEHKFKNEDASKEFQNNLKKISKTHFEKTETQPESSSTKAYSLMKYLVAASVAIIFGVFTFNQFSTPTYSDYSDYDNISFTVRGENDALLKTAENAFNTKDFAKAEDAFKRLIVEDENNSELKLYRAIANIELDNFEVAESLLKELSTGNSAFKHKATWYLALSKLKQEDHQFSLEILRTIPEDADEYEQARKLIKKLD